MCTWKKAKSRQHRWPLGTVRCILNALTFFTFTQSFFGLWIILDGRICDGCWWEEQQKNIYMNSDLPDNSLDSVIMFYFFIFCFPPILSKEGRGVMAIIFIKTTKGLTLPWYPHYALFLCLKLWGTFTWARRAQTTPDFCQQMDASRDFDALAWDPFSLRWLFLGLLENAITQALP